MWRLLVLALYRGERQADALAAYRRARDMLAAELGLEELRLCAHRENVASQRAAVRAGYQRDPGRDKTREVKGAVWPMLGYALHRPGS